MQKPPSGYSQFARLSTGGFAEVWVANAPGNLRVAIKTPKKTTGDLRARFEREVRLQSSLDNPNIVEILDYDLDATTPWYAMPLADGNLWEAVNDTTFTPAQLMELLLQAASGVKYAHDNHILHRDLKPENILLFTKNNGQPTACVSDFGLSRTFTRHDGSFKTRTNQAFGTDYFTAPEQWSDFSEVDVTADIYSMGRILTAILATRGDLRAEHPALERCAHHACDLDPGARYSSMGQLMNEIDLLTRPVSLLLSPVGRVREAIRTALADPTNTASLMGLLRVLEDNTNDFSVLRGLLSRIPPDLFEALLISQGARMSKVIHKLTDFLDEPLPVDAALRIANLLDHCLDVTNSNAIRSSCIFGLIRLASYIQTSQITSILLHRIYTESEPRVIGALAARMEDHETEAIWLRRNADNRLLPLALNAKESYG